MSIASVVFEIRDWFDGQKCADPEAATRFLVGETEYNEISTETVCNCLNCGEWEIIPEDEIREYEEDGAVLLLRDKNLYGCAVVAWC